MNDRQIDNLINKALREEQDLPEGISLRLERQIDAWAATEEKKRHLISRRHILYMLTGMVASILLCLGIFYPAIHPVSPKHELADTYTDPQEAEAAAQKALLFMSQNLNKGIDQVQEVRQEINKINNTLDKHLNN